MARQKKLDRMDDRLVVLVSSDFKAELQALYTSLGENLSDDTRLFWEKKVQLYKEQRAKK